MSDGSAMTTRRAALAWIGALPGAVRGVEPRSPATLSTVAPGRIASDPLFAAALVDLDNRAAPLAPRSGRPMIVNFWARWCGPCRAEIPELVALHARGAGVDIVGINIEHELEPVREFARAYEINYPVRVARDGALDLMRALGNPQAGLPFTLVLDRRGAVVALRLGVLTREHLDAAVQAALR